MGLALLLASAFSGCVARTFVHPLDTIRSRLMVTTSQTASFSSVARGLVRSDGFRGLYRGFGISVCMQAPAMATFLTTYDRAKGAIATATPFSAMSPVTHLISGLAAETVSAVFWVPMEVIKQRAQVRTGAPSAASSTAIARSLLLHEGPRALFKGYAITVGVFGPYSMIYFMTYEQLKVVASRLSAASSASDTTHKGLATPVIATCAASAGAVAAACTTPLDVIKTRLQTQGDTHAHTCNSSNPSTAYRSTWHAAQRIASSEGVRGFFRGVSARVLWITPSTAITMSTFEFLKRHFQLNG